MRGSGRYDSCKAPRIRCREASDRVTIRARGRTFAERIRIDLVFAEDSEYLDTMKSASPVRYRMLTRRQLRARIFTAIGLLKLRDGRSICPPIFRVLTITSAGMAVMTVALVADNTRRSLPGDRTASTL